MPRKLAWIEKPGRAGWGCSECAWVFQAPAVPIGKSLEEILRIIEVQRDREFASHRCAHHPKSKS
jgi:Zn-finger protein